MKQKIELTETGRGQMNKGPFPMEGPLTAKWERRLRIKFLVDKIEAKCRAPVYHGVMEPPATLRLCGFS